VAANQALRDALVDVASRDQIELVVPPPSLCTDNAAMIAWAGAERLVHGLCDGLDTAPRARWPLDQVTKPHVAEPVPTVAAIPIAAVAARPEPAGAGAPEPARPDVASSAVA